jgi:hypothetical protein
MNARRFSPVFLALALTCCSGGPKPHPAPASPAGPAGAVGPDGRAGCAPPSPIGYTPSVSGQGPGLPEVRGTGHGAQLWGLIMGTPHEPPLIRAGDDVKIVWRMTGTGDIGLSVTGPGGRRGRLSWGPELHGGSSYHRPGDEWGAGYHFDRPGCWQLHATRTTATADVWISVAAR